MNSNIMDNQDDKIKLFFSDDENDEVDYDDFKIRPQFQGPKGQELFAISSRLPERFKLDERFAEILKPEYQQDAEAETVDEGKEERAKNIKILESVLGHEVCPRSIDKNKTMKRQIRFDPDDENASHFVKELETPSEKPKKSKKRKVVEEKIEQPIPVSNERYIEVCSNLKEILNTATQFSFSQQFNNDVEEVKDSQKKYEESPEPVEEIEILSFPKKDENKSLRQLDKLSPKQIMPKSAFLFFVGENDPRLKEGISFFKRPKSLDEIRVEWQKRRECVLELFRRKKRSSQRSRSTRVQSMQNKFAVRKQHFKK